MCIFSTHSIIRDPPFSRLDLISCRNLLIYLKPLLQAQIIPLFHYSLRPGGYLFLGSSENLSRYSELFITLDRKNRIFRRRDLVSRPPVPLRQFMPNSQRETATAEHDQGGLLQRSDTLRRVAGAIVSVSAPLTSLSTNPVRHCFFHRAPGNTCSPPRARPIAISLQWRDPGCGPICGQHFTAQRKPANGSCVNVSRCRSMAARN